MPKYFIANNFQGIHVRNLILITYSYILLNFSKSKYFCSLTPKVHGLDQNKTLKLKCLLGPPTHKEQSFETGTRLLEGQDVVYRLTKGYGDICPCIICLRNNCQISRVLLYISIKSCFFAHIQ